MRVDYPAGNSPPVASNCKVSSVGTVRNDCAQTCNDCSFSLHLFIVALDLSIGHGRANLTEPSSSSWQTAPRVFPEAANDLIEVEMPWQMLHWSQVQGFHKEMIMSQGVSGCFRLLLGSVSFVQRHWLINCKVVKCPGQHSAVESCN